MDIADPAPILRMLELYPLLFNSMPDLTFLRLDDLPQAQEFLDLLAPVWIVFKFAAIRGALTAQAINAPGVPLNAGIYNLFVNQDRVGLLMSFSGTINYYRGWDSFFTISK